MKSIATILSVAALAAITTASVKADVSLTFGGATVSPPVGNNSVSYGKNTITLADTYFGLVNLQSLTWSPATGGAAFGSYSQTETVSGGSASSLMTLSGVLENDPFSSSSKRALFSSGVDAGSTLSDLVGTTADWTAVIGNEKVSVWLVNEYFSQAPGTVFSGTRYLQGIVSVSAVPEISTIVAGFASLGILVLGVSVHSKRSVFRIG
jgi:hypothetical protein